MNDLEKDLEHLRLLSIFMYVYSGLFAMFACFPIIHLSIGIMIVSGALNDGRNSMAPAAFGWMFIILASFFILAGWAIAIANFLAARNLKRHTNRLFCLIVSGIDCAFFPMGTAIGVFSFLVLLREPVKELFAGRVMPELPYQQPVSYMSPPDWR
jgi:hypothetical protein